MVLSYKSALVYFPCSAGICSDKRTLCFVFQSDEKVSTSNEHHNIGWLLIVLRSRLFVWQRRLSDVTKSNHKELEGEI